MTVLDSMTRLYRRTGADLPFGDPRPSHRAEMEGWFWRFTDVAARRVVVALCGVNQSPTGPWATVAVALHPGGVVRSAVVPVARADDDRFVVSAPGVLEADAERVHVTLDGVTVDASLGSVVGWPRRPLPGGGIASIVPFLNQYWHPHVLGAEVAGEVAVDGEAWPLDGATAYAEKNWGAGFPPYWWWGQAQGFEREDVCVAFSGGHLALGPLGVRISGIVVRLGDEVVRLAPPTAVVRADVDGDHWRVRGRDLRTEVVIDGDGDGAEPHVLPVPVPAERRNVFTDYEHLAGRLHLTVRRGGRTLFEGESRLAGLETGEAPT